MKLYARYKALELALSIWCIFDMGRNADPFEQISLRTALEVGWIVHHDSNFPPTYSPLYFRSFYA